MMSQRQANFIVALRDKVSTAARKAAKGIDRIKFSAAAASIGLKGMGYTLKTLGRDMRGFGRSMAMRVTLPLAALGFVAGKTAVDIQSGFIGVKKTVEGTAPQLAKIKEELKEMSTVIPVSVTELFKLAETAGQLGIQTKSITSFTKVMSMLAATTNIAGQEGAMQIARFANITGMSQDNFDRLGATIVHLGNNMATTEAEITGMALRLAASGKVVGMTEPQILSLAAAARSVGLNMESGGTAFSRTMLKMDDAVSRGGTKLNLFARIAGKSSSEFAQKFKKDAAGALIDFTDGLQRVKEEGANVSQVLEAVGLSDIRVRDAMLRAAGAGDIFRKAMQLGNTAWKENNALTKEANLRFGSWESKLKIAWNKLKLVSNEIGKILIPAFIALVDILVPILEKFNGLSKSSKTIIIALAGITMVIGPLIYIIGAFIAMLPFIETGLFMLGISGTAAFLPFIVGAAAILAVSAALYQLYANWKALTAEGFLGDFGGWMGNMTMENLTQGTWESGVDRSLGKSTAWGKAENSQTKNDVSLTGSFDINKPDGETVTQRIRQVTGNQGAHMLYGAQ